MTPEELTEITAVQQTIVTRHDREIAQIREVLAASVIRQEQWRIQQEATIAQMTARMSESDMRHEQWRVQQEATIAQINASLAETNASLAETNAGLAETREGLAETRAGIAEIRAGLAETRALVDQNAQQQAELQAMQRLNQEQLALLSAGLVELRNLVADYLQGRSQM